jgi:hypothetical protein
MRKLIVIVGVLLTLDHLLMDGELLLKQVRRLTS